MPRCCAQATPATVTGPAVNRFRRRGASMRDWVLIGPWADQPRGTQYASKSANRVSSSSVTHLQADT